MSLDTGMTLFVAVVLLLIGSWPYDSYHGPIYKANDTRQAKLLIYSVIKTNKRPIVIKYYNNNHSIEISLIKFE